MINSQYTIICSQITCIASNPCETHVNIETPSGGIGFDFIDMEQKQNFLNYVRLKLHVLGTINVEFTGEKCNDVVTLSFVDDGQKEIVFCDNRNHFAGND